MLTDTKILPATPLGLLATLRQVRSLRVEARSETATCWQGDGAGAVEVSEPASGVVIFSETGAWQPNIPGRSAIKFSNVYRWTAVGPDLLRLEHLRFGPSAPVLLFDMAPANNGEWREVSPHHCREDCYAASLSMEAGQLVLAWTVVGPEKRESIRYTYC